MTGVDYCSRAAKIVDHLQSDISYLRNEAAAKGKMSSHLLHICMLYGFGYRPLCGSEQANPTRLLLQQTLL
jgi:hypothetical protein